MDCDRSCANVRSCPVPDDCLRYEEDFLYRGKGEDFADADTPFVRHSSAFAFDQF